MIITGIIAEYNPFHTGHAYQIEEARRITNADYIIVIMSGDFVQRGTPAIADKYIRTKLALSGGADAVLELPVWISTASAADFAKGAIAILDSLKCVDYICFGSEDGDISNLKKATDIFCCEPDEYKAELKKSLSSGLSFPKARQKAFETYTRENADFLALPNNILGISYLMALKELKSNIIPVTVKRIGNFHDNDLLKEFASASAIRSAILNTEKLSMAFPEAALKYSSIPPSKYLSDYPLSEADFWTFLKLKLLNEAENAYIYEDIPKDLANRICSKHFAAISYDELIESLKTSVFTRSRIERSLLHILLNIKHEDVKLFKNYGFSLYVRILGFKKDKSGFLKIITKNSNIPVLTKAMPPDDLSDTAALCYKLDTNASNFYESVKCLKFNQTPIHEYRKKIIVL